MKTIVILLSLGLNGLFLCSFGCKDESSKKSDQETIDLKEHAMRISLADSLKGFFRDSISVDSSNALPQIAEKINKDAFPILKSAAYNLKEDYSGKYILGFGIVYGLNETLDSTKMFYVPVLFKKISDDNVKKNAKYEPKIGSTYYKYIPSLKTFTTVVSDTVNNAINRYKNHITFRETVNTRHFRNFITSDDYKGDARICFYPFQETETVLEHHQANNIYLLNTAQYLTVNNEVFFKHNILLGSDSLNRKGVIFYTKYGNLSHLCPPSCTNKIKFDLK